jgi:surface polysaccharide O-acyltransferase-like enzyme
VPGTSRGLLHEKKPALCHTVIAEFLTSAPASIVGTRAPRLPYLDWLKVLLVTLIIVWHGVAGYTDLESAWPYEDVQEVGLAELSNNLLATLVLPGVLFAMGIFFLISGLVTPGSLARKGPRTFARDRVVRLGAPLVLWVLVIWPLLMAGMQGAVSEPTSYSRELLHGEPLLDTGPMWFVELLLLYSLAYAAWRQWGPPRAESDDRPPPLGRTLVGLAVGISVATLLVRLVFPLFSGQIAHLQLWQWPQYLAMFGLGIVAAQRGWLDPVPDRIGRRCLPAALLGILSVFAVAGTLLATGGDPEVLFERRFHWAPLALAALEGPLVVGWSVWLLGVAQRHLDRRPGRLGRALARSAFGAFILQGAVLIALALALRGVDLPAEVKAPTVASAGVVGSFGLSWLLVTRTRLSRIL